MYKEQVLRVASKGALVSPSQLPTHQQTGHLLKRVLTGISPDEYKLLGEMPLEEAVGTLLSAPCQVGVPLKDYHIVDKKHADRALPGETWLFDVNYDPVVNELRKQSLMKWLTGFLYAQRNSARPKMVLFWHHYFSLRIDKVSLAMNAYEYFSSLIRFSMDDLGILLLTQVTGTALPEFHRKNNISTTSHYAHLAEKIFSLYLFGAGYEGYVSKNKVQKYAKLLYEWSVVHNGIPVGSLLTRKGTGKDASIQFEQVPRSGARDLLSELHEFHARLLNHERVATRLIEKLFRFYVSPEIDRTAEKKIIGPLVGIALEHRYDIRMVLQSLFLNREFFASQYSGSLVRSPVDFVFEVQKLYKGQPLVDQSVVSHYPMWQWMCEQLEALGQPLGNIPDERGWSAYNGSSRQEWLTQEKFFVRRSIAAMSGRDDFFPNIRFRAGDLPESLKDFVEMDNLDRIIERLTTFFSNTLYSREKRQTVARKLLAQHGMTSEQWSYVMKAASGSPAHAAAREKAGLVIKDISFQFQGEAEYHFM